MSDLHPMYARLRGTLAAEQPPTGGQTPDCRHPRRLQRTERTEEVIRAVYSHYLVRVTTEVHCDGCDAVIGTDTHNERRR